MKQTRLGIGKKSRERGSTFERSRSSLERTEGPKRKPMKQSRPKRRPEPEAQIARQWHRLVCTGKTCVRRKCDKPAGPHGHHLVEQTFLKKQNLEAYLWDLENGCWICFDCHSRHTKGVVNGSKVTRDELIVAGIWPVVVAWAIDLDARHFPDPVQQPVLSRLERDYPEEIPA